MRKVLSILTLLLMLTACTRPHGCSHALTAEEERYARELPVDRLVLPGLVAQSGFVTAAGIVTARHGIPEDLQCLLLQTAGEDRSSSNLLSVSSQLTTTVPGAGRLDPAAPSHSLTEAAGDWCVIRTKPTETIDARIIDARRHFVETDFDSPLDAGTEVVVHGFSIDQAHTLVSFVAVVTREKEIPGVGRLYEAEVTSKDLPELRGVSGGLVVRRNSLSTESAAPAVGIFTLSHRKFSGSTLVWFVRPPPGFESQ